MQHDHEVNYTDLGAPSHRVLDNDRRGDIVVARECTFELLLGPPKRRVTRRGGDGDSTRSRPRSFRPRPRPAPRPRAMYVGGHPMISNSYSYEILRRLTILRKTYALR
jgi:hypothetical protein